jgi:hypothetical protein
MIQGPPGRHGDLLAELRRAAEAAVVDGQESSALVHDVSMAYAVRFNVTVTKAMISNNMEGFKEHQIGPSSLHPSPRHRLSACWGLTGWLWWSARPMAKPAIS